MQAEQMDPSAASVFMFMALAESHNSNITQQTPPSSWERRGLMMVSPR